MKRKVILHIGRHKTGTTALQDFLTANQTYLEEKGYYYLKQYKRGPAHHLLSEKLFSREFINLSDNDKYDILKEVNVNIKRELDAIHKDMSIIISSEGFQNVTPRFVRHIFPENEFEVTVVCYFREQVGYIASSFNQEIHAKILDLDIDNIIEAFNVDYVSFIESWERNFDTLKLRIFDKDHLHNGDIIDDFFFNILTIDVPESERPKSNPSLSRKYLSFKLKYNKKILEGTLPEKIEDGKLYSLLGLFSKKDGEEKFLLSDSQKNHILNKCSDLNEKFFKKYFSSHDKFTYQKSNNNMGIYDMSEDEFIHIYNHIKGHQWPLTKK